MALVYDENGYLWENPAAAEILVENMEIKDLQDLRESKCISEEEMKYLQNHLRETSRDLRLRLSRIPADDLRRFITQLFENELYRHFEDDHTEEQGRDKAVDILIAKMGIKEFLFHLDKEGLLTKEDISGLHERIKKTNRTILNVMSRKSEDMKQKFTMKLRGSGQLYYIIDHIVTGHCLAADPFCDEPFEIAAIERRPPLQETKWRSVPLIFPSCYDYDPVKNELIRKEGAEDDGKLSILPAAREILQGFENPVAVLGISGPTRSGKSFLLSTLMGEPDAFPVSGTTDPKTIGIWMGTSYLQAHPTVNANRKPFSILLLDCVGTGSLQSNSHDTDTAMVTLMILLCSTLLFNTLSVPTDPDVQAMKKYADIAMQLLSICGENPDGRKNLLPKVLWILRNFTLCNPGKTQRNVPLTFSDLNICRRQGDLDWCNRFDGVELATLSPPSISAAVIKDLFGNKDSVAEQFKKELSNLMLWVYQSCCTKQKLAMDGTMITGSLLADMIIKYVEQLNSKCIASMVDAFKYAKIEQNTRKAGEFADLYADTMDKDFTIWTRNHQVPLEEFVNIDQGNPDDEQAQNGTVPSLLQIHQEAYESVLSAVNAAQMLEHDRKKVITMIDEKIVLPEPDMQNLVANWGDITGGKLYVFIQMNDMLSKKHLNALHKHESTILYAKMDKTDGTLCTTEQLDRYLQEAIERIEYGAIGAHRDVDEYWKLKIISTFQLKKKDEEKEKQKKLTEDLQKKLKEQQEKTDKLQKENEEALKELQKKYEDSQEQVTKEKEQKHKLQKENEEALKELQRKYEVSEEQVTKEKEQKHKVRKENEQALKKLQKKYEDSQEQRQKENKEAVREVKKEMEEKQKLQKKYEDSQEQVKKREEENRKLKEKQVEGEKARKREEEREKAKRKEEEREEARKRKEEREKARRKKKEEKAEAKRKEEKEREEAKRKEEKEREEAWKREEEREKARQKDGREEKRWQFYDEQKQKDKADVGKKFVLAAIWAGVTTGVKSVAKVAKVATAVTAVTVATAAAVTSAPAAAVAGAAAVGVGTYVAMKTFT